MSSAHHLVPLKTAYLKLHHLLDAGCVFVGHGLAKDFRIINLTVPQEQVRVVLLLHILIGGGRGGQGVEKSWVCPRTESMYTVCTCHIWPQEGRGRQGKKSSASRLLP